MDDKIRTSTDVQITVRELYELVYIKKLSDTKIAQMKGLTSKTIRNWRRKCQFNSGFRVGVMDLPISEVKKLLASGWKDEDIVKRFNTTMTSFISFKRRHGLEIKKDAWPPPRRDLIHCVTIEMTDEEIAIKYGVTKKEIKKLRKDIKFPEFKGKKKSWMGFGTDDPETLPVKLEILLPDLAKRIYGSRLYYDEKQGYFLDGKYISTVTLAIKLGYARGNRG